MFYVANHCFATYIMVATENLLFHQQNWTTTETLHTEAQVPEPVYSIATTDGSANISSSSTSFADATGSYSMQIFL